jgi:deazaflavin-dependent oxidoreductase (nitroreductase family)
MYRSGRPNWVARPQNRLSSILFGAGIFPRRTASLEVTGRRTGRTISFPVVIADWEGKEYLVSMLGEKANWVKNVRAASGAAVLRRGRKQPVTLEEVDIAARAPIIRRYAAHICSCTATPPSSNARPCPQLLQSSSSLAEKRRRTPD